MKTPARRHAYAGDGQQDLFGPVGFSQNLPPRGTHLYRVWLMLRTGARINQQRYLALTGSWRLAAFVEELKNDYGWDIRASYIAAPSPVSPQRYIAEYRLSDEARAAAEVITND